MTGNPHVRAQQLFAQSLVDGLASADQEWLAAHLRECDSCSRESASTRELLSALRAVLELGFVLWWAIPALIAVAVVIHQRTLNGIGARSSSSEARH